MVAWERAVNVPVDQDVAPGQARQNVADNFPGRAVAAVPDNPQIHPVSEILQQTVDVEFREVFFFQASDGFFKTSRTCDTTQFLNLFPEKRRVAGDKLEAVVFLRIMRPRHHDAVGNAGSLKRKIKQRRRTASDL